jgi:hypothetical protein
MAYILPQVEVFQEFQDIPTGFLDTLRAHISGPHAFLLRYDEPDEKALAALGHYDPDQGNAHVWPERPPGGVVDRSYTKLHIDNARLQYFEDLIGADDAVAAVSAQRIRITNNTYGFQANGDDWPRLPALYSRDVKPGDRIYIRGVAGGTQYTLNTFVKAIEADQVAAIVGPATASPDNWGTQVAAATVTKTTPSGVATGNDMALAADGTNYSALADGFMTDTYTVEVVKSSVGGDLTTAELRVTTASGVDDELSVTPGAAGAAFAVGTRGLRLTFTTTGGDDLVVGQSWDVLVHDEYTALTADSGGTYRGGSSTTYIVEFTRGGFLAEPDPSRRPQFRASTVHGTDSSPPLTVVAAGTAYPVGTQGATITLTGTPTGIRKGDRFYIAVTAAGDGRMGTIVLGHSLPAALVSPLATDLDLRLFIERDIMIDELPGDDPNWTQSDTELTAKAGLVAYDEEFTDGETPRALTIDSGDLFVEYRAWLPGLANRVGTINDVAQLDDQISGPLHPDNPLKWGVFKALSNANGSEVKYTAVADPTVTANWINVLELINGRDDVYNLVPLTFDKTVLDLFAAHVDSQSAPQAARWRCLFGSVKAETQRAVVNTSNSEDGDVVLARIGDDAGTSNTQYTWLTVPAGNANFLTNKVLPGDIVRTSYGLDAARNEVYEEYVVDEVINEDTIRLVSGPDSGIPVPQKIEVWHHMTKDEIATDVARQIGVYADRRVKMAWPDVVGSGGILQEGYFLAAALAGLRSGVAPHQGLTNVELKGFDDLSRTTDFFGGAQLNTLAEAGAWIVTQAPDGTVYTRHALTTNTQDVNTSEEMVTANIDSISYVFARRLAPFIGRMNVTPSALLVLEVQIDAVINLLKTSGYIARLGPQLIDGTILKLQRHAIQRDRVVCVLDVALPYPLNNLELHLVV